MKEKFEVHIDNICFAIRFDQEKGIVQIGGLKRFLYNFILLTEGLFERQRYETKQIQKNKVRLIFNYSLIDFYKRIEEMRNLGYIVESVRSLGTIDR